MLVTSFEEDDGLGSKSAVSYWLCCTANMFGERPGCWCLRSSCEVGAKMFQIREEAALRSFQVIEDE